jgi:precorrin-6B methylase 2
MKKTFLQIPGVVDVITSHSLSQPSNIKFKTREMLFLQQLVYQLNNNSLILEIGSFLGKSAVALADAAEKINGTVICVDPFDKHTNSFCPNQKEIFLENISGWDNIYLVEAHSSNFFELNPEDKFDMIFIDGDHSVIGFISDLKNAILRSRKIVCGHDFCMYSPWIIDIIQQLSAKFGLRYEVVGWTWKLDTSKDIRAFAKQDMTQYLLNFVRDRQNFYHSENHWYPESGLNDQGIK